MGGGDERPADGDFSLSWRLEDYLDIQWTKLPRYALSALKGFTGMAKGAAIEHTFDRHFGALTAGELSIPLAPIVYDMDRGAVNYFGSESTPDLTIGRPPDRQVGRGLAPEVADRARGPCRRRSGPGGWTARRP